MMFNRLRQFIQISNVAILLLALFSVGNQIVVADDYFLTIGGGYNPSGNQASLEENVVFFQQVLNEKHRGSRHHDIYFADGDDPTADLQVMAGKPTTMPNQPATDLLASLHRRRGQEQVEYRNHRVPNTTGSLDPALVRASLDEIAITAHAGDRLIIYVTAHGSEGPEKDDYNTTIDCWNEKAITAREFARWLNDLPRGVPVVMVMAQCYCGGFARTIFDDLEVKKGLSSHLRAGFFAQQHNLPAAGCRPDIEHDQEFSSYFWGAIAGRSRVGTPIEGCDIDGNGIISFAEAYAYAVWAGETIDIPLTTSDVLLRTYSRMSVTKEDLAPTKSETKTGSSMTGSIQSFINRSRPIVARIVTKLSKELGFTLQDDVTSVVAAYEDHWRKTPPEQNRGGRRGGSGRRELLKEITEKWPELGDSRHWEESPLLNADNQEQLLTELKQLPSWKVYDERRRQIADSGDLSERHELKEVKYRRLIKTLELIVLEQNLPRVASPEIVERYRQMIALEESPFSPAQ